ncbi:MULTISPECIES: LacI family DNA-binding transcriptional regulator [Bacillaceae]|uniref:LacI family kdg operon repressor n=1 Tax=Peribacillus huizhouensis TaxID=1501239 RepID=A0ABR6CR33_9BACI|nr:MULTISPECIES: substrate-binding domain-containing protein [Bacillaceae]MBA9027414.1 LacI family kdg operon repressor [Peribacillus huizhouensis]
MKRITITDVAKLACVSKSTVSQYLNKRYDYMGETTKLRIENAISQLGYQPNIVARSLKQKRSSTIGVIVANILHSFSTKVIRAIEDTCNENDFHVIVCNADDDPVKEEKYIQMLLAKQIDGMAIFPTGGNLALYDSMVKMNYPVVFLDRMIEGVNIDAFLLDNENASNLAVKHLVDRGHTRIGVVTPSIERMVTPRVERLEGFKKALKVHGLPVTNEYIKSMGVDKLQSGLKEMFSLCEKPTALVASNDLTLFEVLKFVKENGLNIPEEIEVVGFDDIPFATVLEPSLSFLSQPAFEMGNKAAERLLEKIEKRDVLFESEIHRFQPTLFQGQLPKN